MLNTKSSQGLEALQIRNRTELQIIPHPLNWQKGDWRETIGSLTSSVLGDRRRMEVGELTKERFWIRVIYIVSAVVALAVGFLILGPRPESAAGRLDVSFLPTVNASINAITALLLLIGFVLIRRGKVARHRAVMLAAFGGSTAFLASYVVYHWFKSGPASYTGDWRGLYLTILLTHIVLAAAILPLALTTLYRGWNMHVRKHRRIARITLPVWLYVSVTGVLIYWMLYG